MGGLNATNVRREIIPFFVGRTVRETVLAEVFLALTWGNDGYTLVF